MTTQQLELIQCGGKTEFEDQLKSKLKTGQEVGYKKNFLFSLLLGGMNRKTISFLIFEGFVNYMRSSIAAVFCVAVQKGGFHVCHEMFSLVMILPMRTMTDCD